MIRFLREKAQVIGWIIIITFVGTMFTGLILSRGAFKSDKNTKINLSQELALINNKPVNQKFYFNTVNNFLQYIKQNDPEAQMSPDLIEYIQYNAISETLKHSCFYWGAKEAHIKIKNAELNAELERIYKQLNIKGNKELKAALKKNNYPYNDFIDYLKEQMLAQKFQNYLVKDIVVNDKDVENSNQQIKAKHILIKPIFDNGKNNEKKAEDLALAKINKIKQEILNGLPFEEAAKKYSDDTYSAKNGGDLGWFGINQMDLSFEQAAFALEKNEVSNPVKSIFGYHLIKVSDKKNIEAIILNKEERRNQILKARQQRILQQYLAIKLINIKINDPSLAAIAAKNKGNFLEAISNYQQLMSKDPSNPYPDYFIGQLYLVEKTPYFDINKAEESLKKASIKIELDKNLDFIQLHLELAKLYKFKKESISMMLEYNKAFALAEKNVSALKELESYLRKNGQIEMANRALIKISELSKSKNNQQGINNLDLQNLIKK